MGLLACGSHQRGDDESTSNQPAAGEKTEQTKSEVPAKSTQSVSTIDLEGFQITVELDFAEEKDFVAYFAFKNPPEEKTVHEKAKKGYIFVGAKVSFDRSSSASATMNEFLNKHGLLNIALDDIALSDTEDKIYTANSFVTGKNISISFGEVPKHVIMKTFAIGDIELDISDVKKDKSKQPQ